MLELQKYTPHDICRILGISKSTLLFWESNGYIPKAKRNLNLKQSRYWTPDDAETIASYYRKKENNKRENRLLYLSNRRIEQKEYLKDPNFKERNKNNALKRYYKMKQENKCYGCGMPLNEESRMGTLCLTCYSKKEGFI